MAPNECSNTWDDERLCRFIFYSFGLVKETLEPSSLTYIVCPSGDMKLSFEVSKLNSFKIDLLRTSLVHDIESSIEIYI